MPKMPNEYSDEHLKLTISRHKAANSSAGAVIPLEDFLVEREKRKGLGLEPRGLALNIVRIAQQAKHGRASYSDVWHCYNDGDLPQGNHWIKQFIEPFDKLAAACVTLKLPAITSLITEKGATIQSPDGIKNLWKFAIENGVAVGSSPESYVKIQAVEAAQLSIEDIERHFPV